MFVRTRPDSRIRVRPVLVAIGARVSVIGRILKAGSLLLGSSVAAQVVAIVAAPVLTRLYSPADFGVLATAASVITLVSICATLRLEEIIPLLESDEQAAQAAGAAVLLAVAIGVVATPIAWAVATMSGVGSQARWAMLVVVPLAVMLAGIYSSLVGVRLRSQQFRPIARATVDQSVLQTIVQIGAGVLGAGAPGLLVGKVIEKGVGIRRLATYRGPAIRWSALGSAPGDVASVVRQHHDLVWFGLLAAVVRGASAAVMAPLLSAYAGIAAAGVFAIAYRAIFVPFSLVGSASLRAFLGVGARLGDELEEGLSPVILWSTTAAAVIGTGLFMLLSRVGPTLFAFVFGSEWAIAGALSPYVAVMGAAYALLPPFQRVYDVWGLVRFRLGLEAVRAGGVIAVLVLGGRAGLPLLQMVRGVSIIYVVLAVATVAHVSFIVRSKTREAHGD